METSEGTFRTPLYAVAGDPAITDAARTTITGPGGEARGVAYTLPLPTAPFPAPGYPWTDATVRIFVPDGYRDRGKQDLVVHLHGWNQDIAGTLVTHHYEDHVWASGADAILVIPQGPDHAKSGKFGKLLAPEGFAALTREILVVTYRELGLTPTLGDLVLTSHSGGYQAAAAGLGKGAPPVWMVGLFDSLYGQVDAFTAYARAGGRLRSIWTDGGGTAPTNAQYVAGVPGTVDAATQRDLRDAASVVVHTDADHDGTTRRGAAYGEILRWGLRHSRRGPRIELRTAVPTGKGGKEAAIHWISPRDEDLRGFRVETSTDGEHWSVAANVSAEAERVRIPLPTPMDVRVVPVMDGIAAEDALPSDVFRVVPGARVLVVDASDRLVDAGAGRLSDDYAARVGADAGAVATISERALTEDAYDPAPWKTILWLAGADGREDGGVPASVRDQLSTWIAAGGRLVVSGSDVARGLDDPDGRAWLERTFGADPAGTGGGGGLGGMLGPWRLAPPQGYVATPGPLAPLPDADVLLTWEDGTAAAVARPGTILLGFPLELVDPAGRADLLRALLTRLDGK
jgi:hypothetical protein